MDRVFRAALILFLTSCLPSPTRAQFADKESVLLYSVDIGMNPEEVKFVIGKPDAVEAGAPLVAGGKVNIFPDMVEPSRFSTWMYYSDPVVDVEYIPPDTVSVINGRTVSHDLYENYRARDSVFVLDGRIISPVEARQYLVWGGPMLETVKIDSMRQTRIPLRRVEVPYVPILCLSFDHITRVVASKRVLFLRQH